MVEPGNYTLVARVPDFRDSIVEGIEVSADSISILDETIYLNRRSLRTWRGTKIKKVDVRRKGSMTGKLWNLNVGADRGPLANAAIFVRDTFWIAHSDSSGNYHIGNVLPGQYQAFGQVFGGVPGYQIREFYNIRIAPDTTSVVDFPLRSNLIPEDFPPMEWVEEFIEQ